MQAGFKANGTLYIKFAMNFAIPLSKGSQDIIAPTKNSMRDIANQMVGKPFTIEFGGPIIGKIDSYENPVSGHYIFQVVIDNVHKEVVLKMLAKNNPAVAKKLHDLKGEQNVNPKDGSGGQA